MNLPRHFALIPAAGIGARMGIAHPKQYMRIAGKSMLRRVLDTFAATASITHVFVVVNVSDGHITDLMAAAPHLQSRVTLLYEGGATRHESVLNGLNAVRDQLGEDDWVLVHDAARPGLTIALIEHLIYTLHDDPVGGLLALPVVDTLKRADGHDRVTETLLRTGIWAAQTPQMFRYGLLREALQQTQSVTDEASAIEMLGWQPKLVQGSLRNFKVTVPHDVELAELLLKERE